MTPEAPKYTLTDVTPLGGGRYSVVVRKDGRPVNTVVVISTPSWGAYFNDLS